MVGAAAAGDDSNDDLSRMGYYEILGVDSRIAPKELKSAYRRRSIQLHPDKNRNNPFAEKNFQRLSRAYETLSKVDTRKLYDQFGDMWEFMKSYEEESLTYTAQRMFQSGGRMYVKHVKEKIDEPFWRVKDVSILHLKFAAEVLQQFEGVWVLFFGNPRCGPCRATVPKISAFAHRLKASRSWIRVGTVNMAVDGNQALLQHFGRASESIPQVVVLAPIAKGDEVSLDARMANYEVFNIGDDDAPSFSKRLLQMCKRVKAQRVPMVVPAPGELLETALSSTDDRSRRWATLVVGAGCSVCKDIRPVFRRSASRMRHALYDFRVLDCEASPNAALCAQLIEDETAFPLLHLHDERKSPGSSRLINLDPFIDDSYEEAVKYAYDEKKHTFSIMMYALLALEGAAETSAPSLSVTGATGTMAFLNGELEFMGTHQGRGYWKKPGNMEVYLRWIPGKFRGNRNGAWLLTDMMEDEDIGWAYTELDVFVPSPSKGQWTILSGDSFGRRQKDPNFAIEVAAASSQGRAEL